MSNDIEYLVGCECGWRGYEDELENKHKCFGSGGIDICPKCKESVNLLIFDSQDSESES